MFVKMQISSGTTRTDQPCAMHVPYIYIYIYDMRLHWRNDGIRLNCWDETLRPVSDKHDYIVYG